MYCNNIFCIWEQNLHNNTSTAVSEQKHQARSKFSLCGRSDRENVTPNLAS